jgi:glycosyltransferase involved in cell wall biosynthesis
MTDRRPLVSVIIPNHNIENRFEILKEAVSSVLLQNYRPLEIIMVNDPGTDDTYDLVLRFANTIKQDHDLNVIATRLPSHGGTSAARNEGITKANGEFLFFLDCDDLYFQNHIDRSICFLSQHPEYQWTLSPGFFYRNFYDYIKTFRYPSPERLNTLNFDDLACRLVEYNFPVPMGTGICFRKSIFNDSENRFSLYLSKKTAEDIHFGYVLIKKHFRPFFFPSPTVLHRSFWKYKSRSINADQVSDILTVSDYIKKTAFIPIIDNAHTNNSNTRKVLQHLKKQWEIFSVQSLLFRSRYKESILFIIKKPYLYKHWIRLCFIKIAKKEPFSTLHGLYWYYTTPNDKTSKEETRAFLMNVKKQSISY